MPQDQEQAQAQAQDQTAPPSAPPSTPPKIDLTEVGRQLSAASLTQLFAVRKEYEERVAALQAEVEQNAHINEMVRMEVVRREKALDASGKTIAEALVEEGAVPA